MKAFVVSEYAHPTKIQLTHDAPEPVPTPGSDDLLIDVHSSGLNYFDILQSQGNYQTQPPLAGTVVTAPPGSPYKPGDRVFGSSQGGHAERVVANPIDVLPLPDTLSFDEGAGLFITYPTSYEALVGRANLQAVAPVLAAAGGLGMVAVQIGKLDLARTVGGADFVVDYTKEGWEQEVRKITGGRGGRIREALKCIVWGGRALVVGFAGGEIEKLSLHLVLLKNASIIGIYWGSYRKHNPKRTREIWDEIFALFASGRLKAVLYPGRYTLETLSQGLQDLENRKTWGKVIARVREPSLRGKL
ncbi:chaperonin 10-like protein [Multifurca ochricompacta]|uniref:Chaperonin 10-like protein n=1 Tax=Multifurca ochricompacta TaxID=376703 RepID=A0AAD4MBN6_9AGAM|nr:chaperonin 10-like protein [Multifurca ochricompacta]